MFMCSPCLYRHDYSIFAVTREPEQNCRLCKVRWREQQGHNSYETSWGGLSVGLLHSTWWVLPFSCAGRVFSQETFSREGASKTSAAAGQRDPSWVLPSSGAVPMGCVGPLLLLCTAGSGSGSEQAGWCLQPQVQQLVVKPPRAVPAACLLTAVLSWPNLGSWNCLYDIFNLCPQYLLIYS